MSTARPWTWAGSTQPLMGASSQATQEPTTTALSGTCPAPAQLQPTREQAAAATSSTIPTCDWDLQSRDSSAPAVLRQFLLPLQEAAREQGSGPESCRTDCCPRRSINRQEGKSGFFSWGAVTAQVLEGAFAVPRSWIRPRRWRSDQQSHSWGTPIYQNGPYSP